MARDIIFRGKDSQGCWWYGALKYSRCGFAAINVYREDCDEHRSVDPNTVGERVGVKDTGGRELYEGDIIRIKNTDTIGKVYYSTEACRWFMAYMRGKGWAGTLKRIMRSHGIKVRGKKHRNSIPLAFAVKEGIEVVGNVSDSPELLYGSNRR